MGSAREAKSALLSAPAVVVEEQRQLPLLVAALALLRIIVEAVGATRIANVQHLVQEAWIESVPVAKSASPTSMTVWAVVEVVEVVQ